jgi:phosphohistidine phosphatase
VDLILWRHAEAEESYPDMARKLTSRGKKDAARMAEWLRQRLPKEVTVLASPAERTQQTASALAMPFKTVQSLAPGASVSEILKAAGWPNGTGTVIVVGHQPGLGQAVAHLVSGTQEGCSVRKGGLWWFSGRTRNDDDQVVVTAVMSPDLL